MKCAYCGKEFTAKRRDAKYCSRACSSRYRIFHPPETPRAAYTLEIPTVPATKSKPTPPPPPKITIPAAVAENREPTTDELLDWIFSKGATK